MGIMSWLRAFKDKVAKAFSVDDIAPTVMAIGVSAIVGAVVLLVLVGVQNSSSVTAGSATANALTASILGIGNIFAQYPLLGTVVGLVLVLGVVLYFFYGRGNKEGGL
jgi:hypothetical protein